MSEYKSFSYLGSKTKLLSFLDEKITDYMNKQLSEIDSFADLFAGTGIVSFYIINKGCTKVITNDIQHYAYVISSVWDKGGMDVQKLERLIENLNNINCETPTEKDFIYSNYTPSPNCERMYFTIQNGLKIDRIRQSIETYKNEDVVNDKEYRLLLKILLYAVTSVSNTTSVYGAYLKEFKSIAKKEIKLDKELLFKLSDNTIEHTSYNKDIAELLDNNDMKDIEVVYIDSPYNSRGYDSNFFLLENISKYDSPAIHGKTGLRDDTSTKSKFCSKVQAASEFKKILSKIKSKYVFISYSSESIVSKEKMIEVLEQHWDHIICYEKEYKRFKSNVNCEQDKTVQEYLFAATQKVD
jgi:adenine-specific DNA-methyltransferase